MRKRIDYLDIAKGIGILCVIAGHMVMEMVTKFVSLFHMPLFFLISGYFLDTRSDLRVYMKKKARQLLIPYSFTCIAICVFSMLKSWVSSGREELWSTLWTSILSSVYGAGVDYMLPGQIEEVGAIWFLLALIWALLIVKYFAGKERGYIYILSIAYISYVTSRYLWLPFSIQAGGTAAVFVYVGYLARRKQEKMKKEEFMVNYFLLGFGIFLTWFEYKFGETVVVAANGYWDVLFNMTSAVTITYVVLYIANFLDKKTRGIKKMLIFLGGNSLIILCVHLIEINMIPWYMVYNYLGTFSIAKSIQYVIVFSMKVFFAAICVWIVSKMKYLMSKFQEK